MRRRTPRKPGDLRSTFRARKLRDVVREIRGHVVTVPVYGPPELVLEERKR